MGLRAFFIVAAVLVSSSQIVEAAEQSVLRRMSCSVVRFYVAKYSQGAAEAYARSKGAMKEYKEPRYMIRGGGALSKSNGEFGITSTFRQDVEASKRDKELGFRLVAPA